MDIDKVLVERDSTHGDYRRVAETYMRLKSASASSGDPTKSMVKLIPADILMSLDMIYVKLARILCGDMEFKDHWDDIAGYARLISQRLGGEKK